MDGRGPLWEWLADLVWLVPIVAVAAFCAVSHMRESLASKSESWWRSATVTDVKRLLDRGANVNASNSMPLYHAAGYTQGDAIVRLLLDRGANINECSYQQPSALHNAVDAANFAAVALLLEKGAEVNARSKDGTPLHHAVRLAQGSAIVELLLDNGAGIEDGDSYGGGYIPLHLSVAAGNLETTVLLLNRGADVNGFAGSTMPLHIAANVGSRELAAILLDHGADINEYSSDRTPLDIATASGDTAMVEFLLDRGASREVVTLNPRHRTTRSQWYGETGANRRSRRPAEYALSAIPTVFEGRQYRSRLEARWAAFMRLCGWEYEYEHLDLNGWIPDFAIWGDAGNVVWVEVKPVTLFPRDVAMKMEQGLPGEYRDRGDELLILGEKPSPTPRSASLANDRRRIGWLARPLSRSGEERWAWRDCIFGRWAEDAPFGFCYPSRPYHDRITGIDSSVRGGRPGATDGDLSRLWTESGNLVQWRSPRDEM